MGGRHEVVKIVIILLIIGGVITAILEAESILAKIGIGCLAVVIGLIAAMSLFTGVGPITLIGRFIIEVLLGRWA